MGNDIEKICNLIMCTSTFPNISDKDYIKTFVELTDMKNIEELKNSKNPYIQKGLEEIKNNERWLNKLKEHNINININIILN